MHLNPSGLPSQAKLQGLSSVQLARWAIPTLTAADPTGVITGTAATDPTTMDELLIALQNTAASTYSKNQILAHLTAHKNKLNDNFETLALSYVDEFPPLPSSPPRDYGPMNAVEATKLSSKRPYQPTPLELIGSSQSKRHTAPSLYLLQRSLLRSACRHQSRLNNETRVSVKSHRLSILALTMGQTKSLSWQPTFFQVL
jgi:hypothetical protein